MKNSLNRIVFVNGEYVKEEDAVISIFDRGFIFGDGVYEVVPVINGKLVDKKYFLERLDRSLNELSIPWPCSKEEYMEVMNELVARNDLHEGIIYSQVTRGAADRDFPFPEHSDPGFVAFTSVMDLLKNPEIKTGIEVITTPDLRWKRRDIKSVNLLGQVLAKQDAVSKNAKEGWMVEDGFITEGVSSSAYIVKDGVLITRQLSNSILPGIRRRTLLEIAKDAGIEVDERVFTVEEAMAADEAFISSATTMALSVISIDGHTIGDGKPGPITQQLRQLYEARVLAEAAE
ncbi:MAG: D-amino-acid transaminase [Gammaproteobacteria bacterium]|nr:D-amino-acid transaminase [Gammaproteobacteria bacterium]MDD9895225.1 D-amino-acid transaminase [Gammaproteobacteria bacterium]MDD9958893.1 D-amino-acid transaminase [Gammaproteobacteria bacterium]